MKSINAHLNPGFELECYHNLRLSILMNDDNYKYWFYSNFVNLVLYKSNQEIVPYIRFENHIDVYSDLLVEEPLMKEKNWVSSIKKCIDNNNCVIAFINWSKIPQSKYFNQEKEMIHEGLIYGYCDETKHFQMLAFDVHNLPYTTIQVPFSVVSKELDRIFESQFILSKQKWFKYYGFPITRVTKRHINHHSLNKHKLFFSLDRSRFNSSYKDNAEFATGYSINSYLSELFSEMHYENNLQQISKFTNQLDYWKIMNLKLILHKNLMINRIRLLKEVNNSPELLKIEQKFEKSLHNLKIILALTNKFKQKKESKYLLNIANQFRKVHEYELRGTYQLLEYLVKQ
ncbi:hypothetical protein [Cytobacillus firmus]|uniref:hypothetical protein n=1 Tax=Cytobacillus firmus TaxID=1399 RepID=UPI0030020070